MIATDCLTLARRHGSARSAWILLPLCVVFAAQLALPAQEFQPVQFDVRQASAPACATPIPPAYVPPHGGQCAVPQQPCPPKHVFVRLPPCEEEGYPESAPGGGYPEAGGGAFAAPPQTGAAVEGSSRVGIRGFALRLPEIRLEMPTLELPSIVKSRRAAHMELDRAIAPYVQVPTTGYGQTSLATRQFAVAQREITREETAEQPEEERAPEAGADDFNKRCAQLDALHAQLQMKQQCLDQKLMQVDSLLRELERTRCQPPAQAEVISPAAPMPRENLPMPTSTSAREGAYQSSPHAATQAPINRANQPSNPFLRAINELPLLGGEPQ